MLNIYWNFVVFHTRYVSDCQFWIYFYIYITVEWFNINIPIKFKVRCFTISVSSISYFLQNCLKDIEICFETDYPLDLKPKIYFRKADCYFESGQKENFDKCLDEIGGFLMMTLVDERGRCS